MVKGKPVERVVFNAITRQAVQEAMRHPRQIDAALVEAYLARRALDYLVGFSLSPVLWRKLPGARSAGRVQSVALRLVCDRELEIESFRRQEYWTIEATFRTGNGEEFKARLNAIAGARLGKLDISDETSARAIEAALAGAVFSVASVESRPAKRHPAAPFTTSTLQQEASRKLGFAAARTMQVAQRLYEGVEIDGEVTGLITYMRTDGVQMAPEAIAATRNVIQRRFGEPYVPGVPRQYRAKAKNAQEAHEAIRPTDLFRHPDQARRVLDRDQAELYELIWKRTVASQMESADIERTTVDTVASGRDGKSYVFRATGSVVRFDGFLKLYQEGRDDEEDEDSRRLPQVARGDRLGVAALAGEQHFTEPPPRYSEASLIKKMEELGIGRPSTYTAILTVLRERGYVRQEGKKRLIPEDKGRLVTAFLEIVLFPLCRIWLHRQSRGAARPDLGRRDRLERGAARFLARLHGRARRASRTCASAKSWMRSTTCWRRISSRPARTARRCATARPAKPAPCRSSSASSAPSSAARTIPNAATPASSGHPATARTRADSGRRQAARR